MFTREVFGVHAGGKACVGLCASSKQGQQWLWTGGLVHEDDARGKSRIMKVGSDWRVDVGGGVLPAEMEGLICSVEVVRCDGLEVMELWFVVGEAAAVLTGV